MRDYKNVKVPKRYRTESSRTTAKRVAVSRRSSSRRPAARGTLYRILIVAIIAAGAYFGWLGYQWFARADIFQIAGVDVKGIAHIPEKEIREIGGIFAGQNIFLVNIEAAANQTRAHPWVKDVQIHRRLPNRIGMIITERVPAAVLDSGAARYLLDRDGVVIEKVTKQTNDTAALPLILAHGCAVSIGERASGKGAAEALAFLSEISTRNGWHLSEVTIKADSAESLCVLYAGHEFRIGNGEYPEKLRRLDEITADMKAREKDFVYVDLRPERQAAVLVRR